MDRGGLFGVLGRHRFLEFYRTAHGLDLARFQDAFEDFFGRDIEEAWELAARVEPYRVAACPCALGGARAGEDVSHDGASRPTSVAAELSGETWLGPLTRLAQTLVSNRFSLELAAARGHGYPPHDTSATPPPAGASQRPHHVTATRSASSSPHAKNEAARSCSAVSAVLVKV